MNYGPADKMIIFISAISRGLRFLAFSLAGTYSAPDQEQNMNIRFSSSHTSHRTDWGRGGGGGGGLVVPLRGPNLVLVPLRVLKIRQ